jgi:hypothetical protein
MWTVLTRLATSVAFSVRKLYNYGMALIFHTDGKREFAPESRAEKLWRILVGQAVPINSAQKQYCDSVKREIKKVVLNYHTAPEDYVRANLSKLLPQILADWTVDRQGNPLHPATAASWDFAKKYGLWKGRKPTSIVTGSQTTLV